MAADGLTLRPIRMQLPECILKKKSKLRNNAEPPPPIIIKPFYPYVNKSGGVLIHLRYKRKKVESMTDKGKELMKETVENIKKLDKESMMLVKASIDILIARQKMDEKNPTNAA